MSDSYQRLREHFADTYEIVRELSGGGMSQVVLAMDLRHQRRVVIKLLPQSVSAAISAERFEREIMVSARLQHPNIVPVLSSGRIGGLPYYIMPFIEGESVRTRVRRGPLSVRETVNILKDVTRALIFAHEHGVIHRDIKPDNVLLSTGAGAAVVADFGVAKALSVALTTSAPAHPGMTGAGMSIGTPAYMAPEQAAADPSVDHRVDLYALGILGYEMLAGSPPFHGRSPHELLAAQMTEIPAPLHVRRYDVPKALNDLVMNCLEKTPAQRPRSAAALLKLLEQPEVTSGIFAAPTSTRVKDWKTVAAFLGVVAVLVFGVDKLRDRLRPEAPAVPAITLSGSDTSAISVAVLPFRVLGSDARAGAIGTALSAEVATAITSVPRLRVASATSISALGDSARSLVATARLLGVTHLVEGTIQRERSRVRATLRVLRAANDSSVWAETFTGSADSTFEFQERVARGVRGGLLRR